MGSIHHLITEQGVARARELATTPTDRRAVDAAAAVLAEEVSRLGYHPRWVCYDVSAS